MDRGAPHEPGTEPGSQHQAVPDGKTKPRTFQATAIPTKSGNTILRSTVFRVVLAYLIYLACAPATATAQIFIRISAKIILLDSNTYPSRLAATVARQRVEEAVNKANADLAATQRGFQLQLTEIIPITVAAQWFNKDPLDPATKPGLESAAQRSPGTYYYRNNAINLYINDSTSGGVCSYPPRDTVILAGMRPLSQVLLHEVGHFMWLCHTQGCNCNDCGSSPASGECTVPGDDNLADTLPDLACWTREQISMRALNKSYVNLSPAQKLTVDNTFENVMSYHFSGARLTDDQLDRWTRTANDARRTFTTGRSLTVSTNGSDRNSGQLDSPLKTISAAAAVATTNDIILIRGGTFNEPGTFRRAGVWRSFRGPVTVGKVP